MTVLQDDGRQLLLRADVDLGPDRVQVGDGDGLDGVEGD